MTHRERQRPNNTQTVPCSTLLACDQGRCVRAAYPPLCNITWNRPGDDQHTPTRTHTLPLSCSPTHCSIYCITASLGLQWPEQAQPSSTETCSSADRWPDRHYCSAPIQMSGTFKHSIYQLKTEPNWNYIHYVAFHSLKRNENVFN